MLNLLNLRKLRHNKLNVLVFLTNLNGSEFAYHCFSEEVFNNIFLSSQNDESVIYQFLSLTYLQAVTYPQDLVFIVQEDFLNFIWNLRRHNNGKIAIEAIKCLSVTFYSKNIVHFQYFPESYGVFCQLCCNYDLQVLAFEALYWLHSNFSGLNDLAQHYQLLFHIFSEEIPAFQYEKARLLSEVVDLLDAGSLASTVKFLVRSLMTEDKDTLVELLELAAKLVNFNYEVLQNLRKSGTLDIILSLLEDNDFSVFS